MSIRIVKTVIALLLIGHSYAQKKEAKGFTLNGKFLTNYSGYLFLEYDNKKDSCLVVNNHFSFSGKLQNDVCNASLLLKDRLSNIPGLYLESSEIEIEMKIEKVRREDSILSLLTITSVKGTKTSKIAEAFEKFQKQHESDKDYILKLSDKVEGFVNQYQNNPLGGQLLLDLSLNKEADQDQLKRIYSKINKTVLHKTTKKIIEKNLFPKPHINANDLVFDFNLLDNNDSYFNTQSLKGKWFLIDFWASWCGPCREQLPELKRIYTENKKDNFEILGVSIDENKEKWKNALDKEKLEWINVNEDKSFDGEIVITYDVHAIPTNYLINPEGKIVAKNISFKELEKILKGL